MHIAADRGSICGRVASLGTNSPHEERDAAHSVPAVMRKWYAAKVTWQFPKDGFEKIDLLRNTFTGVRGISFHVRRQVSLLLLL
jgi:hypothetical protein